MRTDFSEFSYGYALVEELCSSKRHNMTAAPIFPSLIEEGRSGGGYDVKIDRPGIPLLIQFKRPDVMLTSRSKEIFIENLPLNTPFYRFHIRSSSRSEQHDLLLQHEANGREVYYASPCFHEIKDFNRHYCTNSVITNSIFVRPLDIGPLTREPHHISYDITAQGWCFSDDPKPIESIIKGNAIEDQLIQALGREKRALNEGVISEFITDTTQMVRKTYGLLRSPEFMSEPMSEIYPSATMQLREAARLSQVFLQSQLFIIQER